MKSYFKSNYHKTPHFSYTTIPTTPLNNYIRGVGMGAIWGVSGLGTTLHKSTDLGKTWEAGFTFPSIVRHVHFTSRNIMLVCVASVSWGTYGETNDSKIYRSVDSGISFVKVLDILSGVCLSWSFASDDDGYVYLAEYGYKDGVDNARRVYRSADDGANFIVAHTLAELVGSHMHKIIVDPNKPNELYLSVGDNDAARAVYKSSDRGDNFTKLISNPHPTSAVIYDTHIVWGLDGQSIRNKDYGVMVQDRRDDSFKQVLYLESGGGSAYDMFKDGDNVYVGFRKYPDQAFPASIYMSSDQGFNWQKLYEWTGIQAEGISLSTFGFVDGYGICELRTPDNTARAMAFPLIK